MPFLFFLIATGGIYFYTLSNTIFGGDGGDLLSAILTGGFPHPPGYPLYTILGRITLLLPFTLTPAGKVTLISSFSHLLCFILLYLILKELFGKKLNIYLVVITLLIIAFNYLIWLYSIVPELFALNSLIVLSILYTTIRFTKTLQNKYLYFLSFFIGLGLVHHLTFILILPSILYLLFSVKKRIKLSHKSKIYALIGFLLGISPMLYLFLVSMKNAEITYADTTTFSGFMSLILRQNYGTFVPGPFISQLAAHRFIQLFNILIFIIHDFSLAGLLLILLGIVAMVSKKFMDRTYSIAILIAIVMYGPVFVFYANFPLSDAFMFATVERFYLILYFLLAIPLYAGLLTLYSFIVHLFDKLFTDPNKLRKVVPFIVVVFFILPLGLFFKNLPVLISLKNNRIAENLGSDVLNNAQDNSLVFLAADQVLFNSQYVYYSNRKTWGKRIVIHASKVSSPYYKSMIKLRYPQISLPKSSLTISNLIRENLGRFAIYSNDRYALPSLPDYEWVPQGLLYKLEKKSDESVEENIKNINSFWKNSQNASLLTLVKNQSLVFDNNFIKGGLLHYAIAHQNSAYYFLTNKLPSAAKPHIDDALILNPLDSDNYFLLSKYYEVIGECKMAESAIDRILATNPDPLYINELKSLGVDCYQNEKEINRLDLKIKNYLRKQEKPLTVF